MSNKILNVSCPQCQSPFNYYSSESRPFCSERCRKIDLGHWFQESYVVPLKETVENFNLNENHDSEEETYGHEKDSQYH